MGNNWALSGLIYREELEFGVMEHGFKGYGKSCAGYGRTRATVPPMVDSGEWSSGTRLEAVSLSSPHKLFLILFGLPQPREEALSHSRIRLLS